ncbi:MAG: hypothetical protein ACLSTO_10450 [Bilophila wadsworthia]
MARQKPRFAPDAQCLHGQIHVRTVFFQQFVDEALADVKLMPPLRFHGEIQTQADAGSRTHSAVARSKSPREAH